MCIDPRKPESGPVLRAAGSAGSMTYAERCRLTAEKMDDPRPGDRFEEMYTYWGEVLWRDGDTLLWCKTDGEPQFSTVAEFRQFHAYKTQPGYWATWYSGNGPVMAPDEAVACIARIEAERIAEGAKASMAGASL